MSYLALCIFDLKDGSRQDYVDAYADLAKFGLSTTVTSSEGKKITLPTTTTAGEFESASAAALRDDLCGKVQRAFSARHFTSEIFIAVGGDWGWGHRTT